MSVAYTYEMEHIRTSIGYGSIATIHGRHVMVGRLHDITASQAGHWCTLPGCRRYGLIPCTPDGATSLGDESIGTSSVGWSCELVIVTTPQDAATQDTSRFPAVGHSIPYTTPCGSASVVATRERRYYTVVTMVEGRQDPSRCGQYLDQDAALAAARRWAIEVKDAAYHRLMAPATTPVASAEPHGEQGQLTLGDIAPHRPVAPARKGTQTKMSPAQRRAIQHRCRMTAPGAPIVIDRGRGDGQLTIKGLAALVARKFAELPADHVGPGITGLTHVVVTAYGLRTAGIEIIPLPTITTIVSSTAA